MILRAAAGVLLASLAGAAAIGLETDGLRAMTSETARRLRVAGNPVTVPDAVLETAFRGRLVTMADLTGRTVIVGFIYTRCPTICITGGDTFERMQEALKRDKREDVRLLSVSFDPGSDTPDQLAEYGRIHKADPSVWTIARITDPQQLRQVLTAFGVVVIPDGMNGFVHNSALHIVNGRGRLERILDPNDVAGALAAAGRG